MATVTGLTAARMLEIEAESIVDGEIVGDDLILTRHDGTQVNAGPVRGAAGPTGPAGAPASSIISDPGGAAAPSTYGTGIKIHYVGATANGWPLAYSTVTTVRLTGARAFQQFVQKITGKLQIRAEGDNDTWGAWYDIAGRIESAETGITGLNSQVNTVLNGGYERGFDLVVNGDFEDSLDNWGFFWNSNATAVNSNSTSYTGSFSVQMHTTAAGGFQRMTGEESNILPVTPGQVIEISVYARKSSGTVNLEVGGIYGPDIENTSYFTSGTAVGSTYVLNGFWTKYSHRFTVPAGMYYFRPVVSSMAPTGTDTFVSHIDTLQVRKFISADTGDSGWIAPTLVNDWTNYGGEHETLAYRRIGSRVTIRGLVMSPATWQAHVFTLPAGYRPPKYLHFLTISNDTMTGIRIRGANHATDPGQVILGNPNNTPSTWFSVDAEFFTD